MDKLGKQLQIPEKLGRKWVRMGEEERAAVVLRTLYTMKPSDIGQEAPVLTPTSTDEEGGAYRHGFPQNIPLEDMSSEATAQHKASEAGESSSPNREHHIDIKVHSV